MGHSNGKITAPINLGGDVYPTLGIGPTSNGYDLGYACLSEKINMWSYIKPKEASSPSFDNASLPGIIYDSVNKKLVYDRPKTWYRLTDFDGYDHGAKPLTIDKDILTNPVDATKTTFVLTISPYWADSRYNWGKILGGFTWSNMKIKVEVYNQLKRLVDSGVFVVSSIDSTGKISITLNRNNLISMGDTYIYIKGYFCDYSGNVLCLIPTTSDGFIRKPIVVTQSLSITLGDTTANASGFSVYGQLTNGSTSSKCRLSITNNTSSDYVASSGRPYARYRWRAKDGSYTGQWSGNILMPSCTNIPKSFTRNDVVDAGNPPSYGNVTQWYVDYQVIMH